jgi:hypothetical protein
VLEASPGTSDLTPWIHGLLGTSRTFMVTPPKAQKSLKSRFLAELISYGKSLSQSRHQLLESKVHQIIKGINHFGFPHEPRYAQSNRFETSHGYSDHAKFCDMHELFPRRYPLDQLTLSKNPSHGHRCCHHAPP